MGPRKRSLVLVVEDHADTRALYLEVLTVAGYDCLEAAGSEAALRLATVQHCDVVVMDPVFPSALTGFASPGPCARSPIRRR